MIYQVLFKHLKRCPALIRDDIVIAEKNQMFNPQANQIQVRATLLSTEPDIGSLGPGGYNIENGLFQIDVMFPLGTGDNDKLMQRIKNWFPRSEQYDVNDNQLVVTKVWYESRIVQGYQLDSIMVRYVMPEVTQ